MRGPGRSGARGESFERYYLRQIALGEGCNCAEALVRGDGIGRDAGRLPAGEGGLDRPAKRSMVAGLHRLFRRKPAAP